MLNEIVEFHNSGRLQQGKVVKINDDGASVIIEKVLDNGKKISILVAIDAILN
ncbi:hypothetical protein AB4Z50_34960 [Paenibacillus sp. 2TAB26]|uniref:hypothetical protein n=1 Tax=Paenibacillus sp. 2TAB26 TaxID=3233005 RepID=UPI003F9D8D5F